MKKIDLKYGKDRLTLNIPAEKIETVVEPKFIEPDRTPEKVIQESLLNPVGEKNLSEIARLAGKDSKVTVTLEDHTRPVPTEPLVNVLLNVLTAHGIQKGNITFLIATGIHRDLKKSEVEQLREIIGPKPRLVNHHAEDENELVRVGELSYPDGTKKELSINSHLAEADISILTGDVEFHQLFGYGGGAKSVLPGTADAESVRFNHSLLDLNEAKAGNINNPLRQAAERAADKAGIDFSVNLVLNPDKEPIYCYSGGVHRSFNTAVKKIDELYKVPFENKAELVVVETGGYPKDIDLYQAQKAVENGLNMVKSGGGILLVAKCPDGWGSSTFRNWVSEADNIIDTVKRVKDNFVIGGHKAYIYAQEKSQADLYLISELPDSSNLRKIFNPISVKGLERMTKKASSVSVLKLGSCTIPEWEKG